MDSSLAAIDQGLIYIENKNLDLKEWHSIKDKQTYLFGISIPKSYLQSKI